MDLKIEIIGAENGEHSGRYVNLEEYGAMTGSYAIVEEGVILVPSIFTIEGGAHMKDILGRLVSETGIHRIIFTSAYSIQLKEKLKNIVREWDERFDEVSDYSHCIEVEWVVL